MASEPAHLNLPMYMEAHGEGGDPIVLLHGLGANSYTWRHWVPKLARSRKVILVEAKGSGASPKPRDGRYSPVEQAELLYRLILREDLTNATLVGHSLGGAIVLLTALKLLDHAPERLTRLVLVAGAGVPCMPRHVGLARIPLLGRIGLTLIPTRLLVVYTLRLAVFDRETITQTQIEAYTEPLMGRNARYVLRETIRQLIPDEMDSFLARYPDLDVPTLLLWGDSDRIVPLWVAKELQRLLPDTRLEVLEECGHIPPEEKPEESLKVLLDFLE